MLDRLRELGKPRFHGNGFTQLYLNINTRLHVWHPMLKPVRNHNASIHNHRYDLKSKIYSGRLYHEIYDIVDDGKHDVKIIQLTGASKFRKKPGKITEKTGRLILKDDYILNAGSVYTMSRPDFHTSTNYDNSIIVTIMHRYNHVDEYAQIMCNIDEDQPTHAFDPKTQPDNEKLWIVIKEGLEVAGKPLEMELKRLIG